MFTQVAWPSSWATGSAGLGQVSGRSGRGLARPLGDCCSWVPSIRECHFIADTGTSLALTYHGVGHHPPLSARVPPPQPLWPDLEVWEAQGSGLLPSCTCSWNRGKRFHHTHSSFLSTADVHTHLKELA